MLDTTSLVETPEGVEINLHVAGITVRATAWLIDALLRTAVYMIMGIGSAFFGQAGAGFLLIFIFVVEWFYPVYFEVFQRGQTPGKRAFKLAVVHEDGTPVGWRASMLRNLMRTADMLPFFYGFGVIACLVSQRFQRLGDMVAGTLVVYSGKNQKDKTLPEAKPSPAPRTLSLDEQWAIISFAERSGNLAVDRAEELADILHPLTGVSGEKAVTTLHGYAAWYMGSRR